MCALWFSRYSPHSLTTRDSLHCCRQHHAHAVIEDALKEAQRTEQLLCAYQAAAHMLRYVLEPAGAGADNEGVARGREELAAARARLTGPAELLDALGAC